MKTYSLLVSVCITMMFLVFSSSCRTSNKAEILVKVKNIYTGNPINNARVELTATDGTDLKKVVKYTSTDGQAIIVADYEDGWMYTLTAQHKEYYPYYDPLDYFSARNVAILEKDNGEIELWLTSDHANYINYINFIMPPLAVDSVLQMLKEDNYHYKFIPLIAIKDITSLMQVVEDTVLISKYPVNPLSSYIPGPLPMGMVSLWFIESSRISADSLVHPYERFPSLYPALKKKNGQYMPGDPELQKQAAAAYKEWWNKWSHNSDSLISIDPLAGSGISW